MNLYKKFFQQFSRFKHFKQSKNILFIALSIVLVGWGIVYTNCGTKQNLSETSDKSNSKNLTMALKDGEKINQDNQSSDEKKESTQLCTDEKSCPAEIAAVVKPYKPWFDKTNKVKKLDKGIISQAVPSASVLAAGDIYVTDTDNARIEVFDFSGNYISQWGALGANNGEFNSPLGIALDSAGNVYVVDDGNNRIEKFDPSGNYISQFGIFGTSGGQFNFPFGIAIDSANNIYVSDNHNDRIQKFDSAGNFILTFGWGVQNGTSQFQICTGSCQGGIFGPGSGQFNRPTGIAISAANDVYVLDYGNARIQKFDSNGNYISQWGTPGTANGQFVNPYGIATNSAGDVYVADTANARIQKFDSNGNYISQWGAPGTANGQFLAPYGVAVDTANNVYVVELSNNRIQKFDSIGGYLFQWGTLGNGNGQFTEPAALAIRKGKPDLVVDAISSAQSTVPVGATTDWDGYPLMGYPVNPAPPVPVDVTIKNIGNADAIIPATMSIDVAIGCTDPTYVLCGWPNFGYANTNFNGWKSVPIGTAITLPAGATYIIHTDTFFPWHPYSPPYSGTSTYTGPMSMGAIVDSWDGSLTIHNLVPESNETNNCCGPFLPLTVVP